MAQSGVGQTLLAALQASLSVLLVVFYGGLAARFRLLSPENTKSISKVCVRMFLPALLITKVGAELHAGSAAKYGLVVAWGLLAHFLSFLLGCLGHSVLNMPDWVTVAVMFNNTASYPLLLIGALQQTGILSSLLAADDTAEEAVERAKSYFLVFSTVSSCLTFAVGPRLIDTEHAPETPESTSDAVSHAEGENEATEETRLLNGDRVATQRRASLVPRKRWSKLSPRAKWWLVFVSDFFNAPLVGAILGAVIGLTPPLHRAFFSDTQHGGVFTAWLTASLTNIGTLFVPLPVVIAGTSLYTAYESSKEKGESKTNSLPWITVSYIMFVRFVLWPVVAIGVIYLLAAKTAVLGDDPMLWFAMMLMPCGPPAMKLIALVQLTDSDQEEESIIAKLLTISYLVSPILSFAVVGSLKAAQAAV